MHDMPLHRRGFIAVIGALLTVAACFSPVTTQAAESRPKIGIIGSGNVGSALGEALTKAGYRVMFSSRTIDNDRALAAKLGANASAGTPEQAAAFGEVLIFAVPYGALPDLGKRLAGPIKDKVVIDACNPFPTRDGEIANWAREKGSGLASAELLPGARIVRAFNAVGAARMRSAHESPGQFGMPIASDDPEAVAIASPIIRDIGYEPVLIGGLDKGKVLIPGSALAGERPADEVRRIAAGL